MYTSTLLLTLLLSAGALTHPTTNTTTPLLSKRAHFGWVASYAPTDFKCRGGWAIDEPGRPEVSPTGACVKFIPASDNFGISWGSSLLGFGALNVYHDEHCKVKAGTVQDPGVPDHKGAQTCVSVKAYGGGNWGSVRSTSSADPGP